MNVNEVDTVKPTNSDAVIKLDTNPTVKTLAGAEQSATGFTTTFSDQLFFYVPGPGSTEKIRLLGYASEHPRCKGDQVTDVPPAPRSAAPSTCPPSAIAPRRRRRPVPRRRHPRRRS